MAGERGDEGSGSGEGRNMAKEEKRGAQQGEEDSDVSDTINEGVIGMKSPTNPDPINDDYPIMDVTFNSLAHLNLGNNN